ncbi:MAG: YihY/virulence factor BrkB family protein, partial [Chloroflexi bacterium]|nr:YihY/virulence factor BrkB family protein [Chloroflexota bacterium]
LVLLYRYLPNTRVAWRDVWLGAAIAGVLFNAVRIGLAWYVARFSSFQVVYGSLGAIMAVMAWAYLSSLTIVLGAQVSYTSSRVFGSRSASDPLPELRASPKPPVSRDRRLQPGPVATVVRWLLPPRSQ